MIIKIQPDKQKAIALKKMAEITLERISKTDLEKYPSNTLTDYCDIIHKLMEAISLAKGYKSKGEGAHQELIDWISKELQLQNQLRDFLQQMRDYRNRIDYEGFIVHKNYIELHAKEINLIINLFISELEKNRE